jgi:hypothetical protein
MALHKPSRRLEVLDALGQWWEGYAIYAHSSLEIWPWCQAVRIVSVICGDVEVQFTIKCVFYRKEFDFLSSKYIKSLRQIN